MLVAKSIEEVRAIRWADSSLSWGLVPTMGYLHAGHLSLVRQARQENDCTAVSIYVNPTQFAPTEDLDKYPRDLAGDLALLLDEGVDLVFAPSDRVMYPPGFQTFVDVQEITRWLEGASRPTHFRGVTTVVTKLFNIVQPTRAYFGQKDAQQAAVIRRMVTDLDFNVDIVVCPIVREPDGLAMSSRNARLPAEARNQASVLFRALSTAREAYQVGERRASVLRELMQSTIATAPLARLDYVSVADRHSLEELDLLTRGALLSLAVFFGDVRLIDNQLLE
jgi:pantoate--beta-alanine ligase